MNNSLRILTLAAVASLSFSQAAMAQVAGSTPVAVSVLETSQLAMGWSAKKSILGKTVYNDAGVKVGRVEDLIVSPDRNLSYLIVGAGGFVGIGRHDVAVPMSQIQQKDGRIVMLGATPQTVKAMSAFEYTDTDAQRRMLLADAEDTLNKGRQTMGELERKALVATAEAKVKLEQQMAIVKVNMTAAEARLSEMKQAGAARWREFETAVKEATATLRKSFDAALA